MYEFNTEIDLPFDQAVEKVRELLLEQHLGIVSDVDVQAILFGLRKHFHVKSGEIDFEVASRAGHRRGIRNTL